MYETITEWAEAMKSVYDNLPKLEIWSGAYIRNGPTVMFRGSMFHVTGLEWVREAGTSDFFGVAMIKAGAATGEQDSDELRMHWYYEDVRLMSIVSPCPMTKEIYGKEDKEV